MKRIKFLYLVIIAGLFIVTGCQKDEDPVIMEDNITINKIEDIALSEEALAQMLDDVNNSQLKNGSDLFYMVWEFGPNADMINFRSKMRLRVDNPSTQILLAVTYFWDEDAPGYNKWKQLRGPAFELLDWEVVPGNLMYHCASYRWNPGDRESFCCAVYQYDMTTGALKLLSVEWKIDIVIDWLVW